MGKYPHPAAQDPAVSSFEFDSRNRRDKIPLSFRLCVDVKSSPQPPYPH